MALMIKFRVLISVVKKFWTLIVFAALAFYLTFAFPPLQRIYMPKAAFTYGTSLVDESARPLACQSLQGWRRAVCIEGLGYATARRARGNLEIINNKIPMALNEHEKRAYYAGVGYFFSYDSSLPDIIQNSGSPSLPYLYQIIDGWGFGMLMKTHSSLAAMQSCSKLSGIKKNVCEFGVGRAFHAGRDNIDFSLDKNDSEWFQRGYGFAKFFLDGIDDTDNRFQIKGALFAKLFKIYLANPDSRFAMDFKSCVLELPSHSLTCEDKIELN